MCCHSHPRNATRTAMHKGRQRGDSNPCGQSPMDFESISLTTRTHCLRAEGAFFNAVHHKVLRGAPPGLTHCRLALH